MGSSAAQTVPTLVLRNQLHDFNSSHRHTSFARRLGAELWPGQGRGNRLSQPRFGIPGSTGNASLRRLFCYSVDEQPFKPGNQEPLKESYVV